MTSNKQMKSASRLYAVQALFQMEASAQGMNEVRDQFINHRFGATYEGQEYVDGNIELFEKLLFTAVNQQAAIDQMTDRALVAKWPMHDEHRDHWRRRGRPAPRRGPQP